MLFNGPLSKMKVELRDPVRYTLAQEGEELDLNDRIGESLKIEFSGEILCVHCGRKTRKSFNQGYCYPCFSTLAQCDTCIVRPELCHYDQGTCREPEWADDHCMQDHIVYLANSSGVKVGITRHTQVPTRWIDQGAIQAMPVFRVSSRLQAGLMEVVFKSRVSDRTSWQKMLKGGNEEVDLQAERDRILEFCADEVAGLQARFGSGAIQVPADPSPVRIHYPVEEYPARVKSLNLDKTPAVDGRLMGIKGQYLIFDTGVLNVRKFGGYVTSVQSTD